MLDNRPKCILCDIRLNGINEYKIVYIKQGQLINRYCLKCYDIIKKEVTK